MTRLADVGALKMKLSLKKIMLLTILVDSEEKKCFNENHQPLVHHPVLPNLN